MYVVFVVGTAGAGKSLLTGALKDWLSERGWDSVAVNMDPGADILPYEPDVDIREYVDLYDLMERQKLGPNGALMLALDLAAARLPEIGQAVDGLSPEYVLVDTPGQMEPFAYRPSGPYIVERFPGISKAALFLVDGWLVSDPVNFLSISLLAASVKLRFKLPFISLLTKADMIEADVPRITGWASRPSELEDAIRGLTDGENYLVYTGLLKFMARRELIDAPIPISSKTRGGFIQLSSALANIFTGGEDVQE